MCKFRDVPSGRLNARTLLMLFLTSSTIFFLSTYSVKGEMRESSYVGWAFALGPSFWIQPSTGYEATSIGTIKIPCNAVSVPFSAMAFLKEGPSSDPRMLWQLALDGSWFQEKGLKRWTLYGYPATAKSKMNGLDLSISVVLYYLKVWKIWFGSGYRVGRGVFYERLIIHLNRDGQDVLVFNPKPDTWLGTISDYAVLSVKMLEGFWGAWELQLGYSNVSAWRYNGYNHFTNAGIATETRTSGWYIRVRKIFPLDFNWKRMEEVKPEVKPEGS